MSISPTGLRPVRHRAAWFVSIALALVLGNLVISRAYSEHTGLPVPEWTVGFDLLVLLPLAYVLLYRPSFAKALLAVLALASLGVLAGAFIIPQEDKHAWLLFERVRWVYLGGLLAGQVVLLASVLRDIHRARAQPNLELAVHGAIAQRIPEPAVARLLQADARMWLYAFVRDPARFRFAGDAFHGHQHDGNASIQQAFLVLVAMEIPVAHVLLHLFAGSWVAALVTTLSLYGWLFLYADYRATLLRPTTLEPAGLHVRNGVLGDVHVPYDRIARLEEVAFRPRRQRGALRFVGAGRANVALHLAPGTRLHTLTGEREARVVYVGLDEAPRFIAAVRARAGGAH